MFEDAGVITLVYFISPLQVMRKLARDRIGDDAFVEVYVKASIEECIKRDPKGMYKKAIAGQINDFTGISAIYENPENPDVVIDTENLTIDESVKVILNNIKKRY